MGSGAPDHMTQFLQDVVHVEKVPDVSIAVADGTAVPCQVKGKGITIIDTMDDDGHLLILRITNVLYVPGLPKRMLNITAVHYLKFTIRTAASLFPYTKVHILHAKNKSAQKYPILSKTKQQYILHYYTKYYATYPSML
jgi:hypothetical protein